MNYSDTLFFIAKCLTISSNQKNKIEVEKKLINVNLDWDSIVKVSTSHFVFPALYQNLKNENFLDYLPEDLIKYMKYISELNRERNLAILEQVKDINEVLLSNNIVPIFLKGASFIVEDLYNDISERMIGDIDFIVPKHQFKKSVTVLKEYGYKSKTDETGNVIPYVHYPKMTKKNHIAAIEVHRKLMNNKYSKFYEYNFFTKNKRVFDNINVPSLKNQIIHNCVNAQLRDNGKYYKSISLRKSYDLLNLSLKSSPLQALFENRLNFYDLNNYLALTYKIFGNKSLKYDKNKYSKNYIKKVHLFLKNLLLRKFHSYKTGFILNYRKRIPKVYKILFNGGYRSYFLKIYFKK